jgi:hypothetical protein
MSSFYLLCIMSSWTARAFNVLDLAMSILGTGRKVDDEEMDGVEWSFGAWRVIWRVIWRVWGLRILTRKSTS